MTDLSRLGTSSRAIWTREEALGVVTRGGLAALLRDGAWWAPFPHVLADGGISLDPVQWAFAAARASGYPRQADPAAPLTALKAVPCGRTAARVLGLPLIDDDDPATGAMDRLHHDVSTWSHLDDLRSRPRTADEPVQLLHRHQLGLGADDLVQHVSGLWLTGYGRTLLDLAALVSLEALVCAIDHALHRELVRLPELLALADIRGGRWTPRFREALALADEGAESPAETLARLLLRPVLPGLRTQVVLRDAAGRPVVRFDLADESLRLAFEADGKRGHAGDAMVAKDRGRDARTEVLGWRTERATWFELRCRQEQVRRRVVAVAARRRTG